MACRTKQNEKRSCWLTTHHVLSYIPSKNRTSAFSPQCQEDEKPNLAKSPRYANDPVDADEAGVHLSHWGDENFIVWGTSKELWIVRRFRAVLGLIWFERFQNSLWETHTKISNKQLQKATMFFWNIQQLLKLLFSSKRSLKNNFLAQKTTFTKFQEVSKTTFCRKTIFTKFQEVSTTTFNKQNNLKKLLKTMYVLTDLWTQYDNMFSCCILPQAIWTCDWICLSRLASQQVQSLGKD